MILSKSLYLRAMLRGKAPDIDIGHRLDAAGEQAQHFEYLAGPGEDPRKEMAEKLLGALH